MGLAASQCRLLFITSRQNDVSFKMQKISNDRLTLARDEDDAYVKYNRMLNATKYQNSDGTNLSYDAIMGSMAARNGVTRVIQNSYGQVVLNGNLASKLGLTQPDGTGVDFQKLYKNPGGVEALIKVAEPDKAGEIIEQLGNINDDGLEKKAPTGKVEFSINDLVSGYKGTGTEWKYGKDKNDWNSGHLWNTSYQSGDKIFRATGDYTGDQKLNGDGEAVLSQEALNIGNLYQNAGTQKGMVVLGSVSGTRNDGDETSNGPTDSMKSTISKSLNAFISDCADQLQEALVKNGLDETKVNGVINNARGKVYDRYNNYNWSKDFWVSKGLDDNKEAYNERCTKDVTQAGYSTTGICCMYACSEASWHDPWLFMVNGGSIVRDLINEVMTQLVDTDTTPVSKNSQGELKFVSTTSYAIKETYYPSGSSKTDNENTPTAGSEEYYKNLAKYYNNLYNQLSACGWTTQSNETIQSNLNQGLYYVGGTKISEQYDPVADDDAKDAAKAWYDHELKKIKRKEDQMDLEKDKLQTEYNALTNDYNSVKSIIDANVQKSFAYCQSG